jgi:hypothetical protein
MTSAGSGCMSSTSSYEKPSGLKITRRRPSGVSAFENAIAGGPSWGIESSNAASVQSEGSSPSSSPNTRSQPAHASASASNTKRIPPS